jgi:hypothetical protein
VPDGELPIRKWSIEIYFVRDDGKAVEASIFDKVMYELHPSFGPKRAKQSKSHLHSDQQPADRPPAKKDPPFRIDEEGWGEFEMIIHFTPLGRGAEIVVNHDLNFQQERYEVYHDLVGGHPVHPIPLMAAGLQEPQARAACGNGEHRRSRKRRAPRRRRDQEARRSQGQARKLRLDHVQWH